MASPATGASQQLDQLREQVREQLRKLQERWVVVRDQALDVWGRLSERDRQLATILGSAAGVLLLALVVWLASHHLSRIRSDIDRRTRVLAEVSDLRSEFRGIKDRLDAVDIRLKSNTTPPKTFLEDKAREVNILGSVDSMVERTAPPNDLFKAALVEVSLKKVSLANLTRYLYKIEASSAGMTIHSLDVKPNFQDGRYLDATLQVLSLRPKD